MLPSVQRLSRATITTLLTEPLKVAYNPIGTLKYTKSKNLYFSVVISRKHLKTAVLRNKLRRRIYSILSRENTQKPLFLKGILYTSAQAGTFSYADLTLHVQKLLQKTS